MSDYDKETWQAEQAARDQAQTAYRDKMAKARERSARNAKRKIARLHAKLTELGHISDFEDEFGESVLERLEKYGSAFHDLEKGRAGDALSIAQKQVVARMNKKVKELKAKQQSGAESDADPDADYVRTADRWKSDQAMPRSSFKAKRKNGFQPRVRQIEDAFDEDSALAAAPQLVEITQPPPLADGPDNRCDEAQPYIPKYTPPNKGSDKPKRPFLRLVT